MRASWHALRADLVRTTTRHSFQTQYQRLRASCPELQQFPDPAALLDRLHDTSRDWSGKNALLRALIRWRSHRSGDAVQVLLLLALWSGLDAVHRRLLRDFLGDPGMHAMEIASRFTIALARLRLDKVNAIAATLIMNVERDIRRETIRERNRTRSQVELFDDLHEAPENQTACAPYTADDLAPGSGLDLRLRGIIGADSQLVIDVTLRVESQRETAEHMGISHDAARKRYQRAMRKLELAAATDTAEVAA